MFIGCSYKYSNNQSYIEKDDTSTEYIREISKFRGLFMRDLVDSILHEFDSIPVPKIFYACVDKDHLSLVSCYVILDMDTCYDEYFVAIDSLNSIAIIKSFNVFESQYINSFTKDEVQETLYNRGLEVLSQAEPIFDLKRYHNEFVTHIPYVGNYGYRSMYFVLKDIENKRYGEFYLDSSVALQKMNTDLLLYMVFRSILMNDL